jgi:hypothetical protein
MRRALALKTGLAVLLWFFAAPFFHLHASENEGQHHQREIGHDQDAIVHFHLPGHHLAGKDAMVSTPGENEKPLDSFAIVRARISGSVQPFVPMARMEAPLPSAENSGRIAAPSAPRAHDPPDLQSTKPRAPPV